MKNLVLSVAVLLAACLNVFGQRADVASYGLVVKCGTVSVYTRDDEFRMVVGSVQNPKASLLLGVFPEAAAAQMDRIAKMGENEVNPGERRIFQLCGEPFLLTVSGTDGRRKYSFQGINTSVRFSLSEKDVRTIRQAILNE